MQTGRFRITRELGRGGMGIVYEATDPVIGRTVAVKTIRIDTSADTDFLLDRLFREARAAGALHHPNIVTIFDVGRDGDLAYIAMERVDGPSLEAFLQSDPKPSNAVVMDILRQAADALDHAHETGVVHRDIKPANIMLHKGKTVKIADVGIAKVQDTSKSSHIMGTPKYMSPEHITGKPVDGRSDQFALAAIAFKMLTGELPFPGEDVGVLVYQIAHGERPAATQVNPMLRSAVDPVLRRALATDPNDRYRTCSEFAAALADALTGSTTESMQVPSTPASPPPAVPPARSKAPLVYIGVGLVIAVAGWLVYSAVSGTKSKPGANSQQPAVKSLQAGDARTGPKDKLTYVWIAPGAFSMGCPDDDTQCSDDELPSHNVTLTKGFWIGQTEVTQEAYEQVTGTNPSNFRGKKLPVENVTWNMAQAYCRAVDMRLPSEAEWEFAAHGGNPSARYATLNSVGWHKGNSDAKTHEVAQKLKNGYGLYDMLGNVWEWTADFYDDKYYATDPPPNHWIDPSGPASGTSHALAGGSWFDDPTGVRASARFACLLDYRDNKIGFRCAGNQ